MPQQNTVLSYLYQQYQNDLDLKAFVDAYNNLTQQYVTYLNTVNLPIYTGLSGALLDWVAQGLYGVKRPVIGTASGAVYDVAIYDVGVYGSGGTTFALVSDDIFKRILTWKLYRGDGFVMSISWLKKRLKRFLIGTNGAALQIDSTPEISVKITQLNQIDIAIHYPSDTASVDLLIATINSGHLDLPWQYNVVATKV